MTTIDLNADLGELPGDEGRALDAAILAHVTSVSVACGGHAGDAETMKATFEAAQAAGVAVGVHPSYPDRDGFGRRSIEISTEALTETLAEQVALAVDVAGATGTTLRHLKPHGALYHDARQGTVATVVVDCARRHRLALYGPPDGEIVRVATEYGVPYCGEGFADRAYRDGVMVPRSEPGAVIDDESLQADQAVRLALGEAWADGPAGAPIRTICLHGDTRGAASAAAALRRAIEGAGVRVAAPSWPA